MPPSRRARWIEAELSGLVDAGVLAPEAAGRVREHYRAAGERRTGPPLFAVLGGALIGLGLVLLLAHNWPELSRGARVAVAGGWLVAGQALAAFALLRRSGSTAWTEAGALFACTSVAGALALIDQTYQLPSDLGSFLSTWAWLALPLAYALDARASLALLIALATVRVLQLALDEQSALYGWALLAATFPYLVSLARRPAVSARDSLVAWIAVPGILLASLFQLVNGGFLVLGALVLCVAVGFYALGAPVAGEELAAPYAATPARVFGAGTAALAIVCLSHAVLWDGILGEGFEGESILEVLPLCGLGVLALGVLARRVGVWRRGEWARLLFLATPLVYFAAGALALASGSPSVAAWTMALFALALGSTTVLAGSAEGSIGRANAGMLLLGAVICVRFLDSEWSFTVRGLVFIALGVAFLALNLRLRSRRRREAGEAA